MTQKKPKLLILSQSFYEETQTGNFDLDRGIELILNCQEIVESRGKHWEAYANTLVRIRNNVVRYHFSGDEKDFREYLLMYKEDRNTN